MSGEFGVENLKKVLIWGAKLSEAIVEAIVDDGKVDFREGVDIGIKAVGVPFKAFKNLPQEIQDMSEEERNELVDAFIEEFDISNEDAEKKVEQAISLVMGLIEMIFEALEKKHAEDPD